MAAQAAVEALGLERLLFIPSGSPPLKGDAGLVAGEHRLEMIRRAIAGEPRFEACDVELRRAGKSFTIDTVRTLKARHPADIEMVFLIGADCVHRLARWKDIAALRELVQFVVLQRAGEAAEAEPDLPRVWTPAIGLSSTSLRERLAEGRGVSFMTPAATADYIAEHDLYHTASPRQRIERALLDIRPRVIACSGGVDSLLLATLAHRLAPDETLIVHALSPAVPEEATARVMAQAKQEGWRLKTVRSGEFADERYLSNPVNRCYFCKSNLYSALTDIAATLEGEAVLLSGANQDDLGEYRPGLDAAAERGVRHPWIEAGLGKADIRAIAAELGLPFATLAASPCLASRLYTGTRVTAERLRAVERGEALIRARAGIEVVRCRVRERELIIEVQASDRHRITDDLTADVLALAQESEPALASARLDAREYRPGRAFVGARP